MAGYAKLYGNRLLRSTVWVNSDLATKVVWITMLAMADKNGVVETSIPGLAHDACVSIKEVEAALKFLSDPDEYSQTKDYDGRRIQELDHGEGWLVLNYQKFREYRTAEQVKEAEKKARYRANKNNPPKGDTSTASTDVPEKSVDKSQDTGYGDGDGDGSGDVDGSGTEISEEGEDLSPGTAIAFPTAAVPIRADEISTDAIVAFAGESHKTDELLTAYATALFSYYCAITKKRKGQTFLSVDRLNRLKHHIKQRGLSFCLYVVDGGVKHPHLNQTDKGKPKTWELSSFFPMDNADRLEKLVAITKISEKPVHPLIGKYPALGGGDA